MGEFQTVALLQSKTPALAKIIGETPTMYWSDEEADMWKVGTPFVRPHPINANVFFNWILPGNRSVYI